MKTFPRGTAADVKGFSPKLERLWRHELQRVRRPVKIDDVELHRRVDLARLHAEQTDFRQIHQCSGCALCQPHFPFRMMLHKVQNDRSISKK